ncbi:MAG: hypothetical protein ACXVAW_18835 [Vulcanimicrobiaceae bacterium]
MRQRQPVALTVPLQVKSFFDFSVAHLRHWCTPCVPPVLGVGQ